MTAGVGTGYIRAPEVESGLYGKSADVFAYGFLVWMCIADPSLPLPGAAAAGTEFDRLEPKRYLPASSPTSPTSPLPCCVIPDEVISDGCPKAVVSIMCSCWGEQEQRPNFETISKILAATISEIPTTAREVALLNLISPQYVTNNAIMINDPTT